MFMNVSHELRPQYYRFHCGLKVSRSQAKIDENFANYFLITEGKNKCFIELNVHVKGYRSRLNLCVLRRKIVIYLNIF